MGKVKPPKAKGSKSIIAPETSAKGGSNHLHPVFCFKHLRGIEEADHDVCSALATGLRERAQLTWAQITLARRQGFGSEKIPRGQIGVSLAPFAADLEAVLSFRLSSKWRLLAHRDEQVLRLLYVDGEHGAY